MTISLEGPSTTPLPHKVNYTHHNVYMNRNNFCRPKILWLSHYNTNSKNQAVKVVQSNDVSKPSKQRRKQTPAINNNLTLSSTYTAKTQNAYRFNTLYKQLVETPPTIQRCLEPR